MTTVAIMGIIGEVEEEAEAVLPDSSQDAIAAFLGLRVTREVVTAFGNVSANGTVVITAGLCMSATRGMSTDLSHRLSAGTAVRLLRRPRRALGKTIS